MDCQDSSAVITSPMASQNRAPMMNSMASQNPPMMNDTASPNPPMMDNMAPQSSPMMNNMASQSPPMMNNMATQKPPLMNNMDCQAPPPPTDCEAPNYQNTVPMMNNMGSQSPAVAKYTQLLASSKFLFIVYYRGHWCPFCRAYITTLQSLSRRISAAGGNTLIITAEPGDQYLTKMRDSTGYTGEAIVDTQNSLVQYFREKGLVNVAITEKKGYEFGMAQPAVLVIKSDGTVLEKWAIVPSAANLGGLKDRPELGQVWENVQALLEGKQKIHSSYKLISFFKILKGIIF